MYLATVIGQVWATRKEATLAGLRLLVVQPYLLGGEQNKETIVAVDTIGADLGERVLVVMGRAARHAIGKGHDIGFQCAIVGVIDGAELAGGQRVGQTAETDRSEPTAEARRARRDTET
jgi:ethanolamine utilization protein EutN